ncbi:MAG: tRNA pseudouridine(55) synthase TruB [Gammaproteobacteria bacterium]|nr:tRNA pseudouridine(55) synthase TruB [Gammaproteobacteria bacterium]
MAKKNKFGRDIHGLLVLDKSLGLSSNHALQRVKRLFNAKKAGHTGTLDPLATGVLVICFGRATKIADHVMGAKKSYYVVAKLGEQTDTGDKEGQVVASEKVNQQQLDVLVETVKSFQGDIEQIPPMYSAIKKDGVPMYKFARQGKQVERASRQVHIHSIAIENIQDKRVAMTVHCSKGTYIRTLVEDIGKKLGCLAHVDELRRLSVGEFGLAYKMYTYEQLEQLSSTGVNELEKTMLPVQAAFVGYPRFEMKNGLLLSLEQGGKIRFPEAINSKYIRIYDTNRIFRGLGEKKDDGFVHFSKFYMG